MPLPMIPTVFTVLTRACTPASSKSPCVRSIMRLLSSTNHGGVLRAVCAKPKPESLRLARQFGVLLSPASIETPSPSSLFVGIRLILVVPEVYSAAMLARHAQANGVAEGIVMDPDKRLRDTAVVAVPGPEQREVRLLPEPADMVGNELIDRHSSTLGR